jgi:serine/threonine-protein kinase
MSPEQVTDPVRVGARSDLYSLGAVAYFLLTGQPPFVRPTAAETMTAHLREAVLAPSRHTPDLPRDLEELVLACLDKDPSRRPASAEELGLALGRCACAGLWTPDRVAGWWREHREQG